MGKVIGHFNRLLIGAMPDRVIESLGEKYLAGHSLEEGIAYMHHRWVQDQVRTTFDILGEDAHTVEQADEKMHSYLQAIKLLKQLPISWGWHYHDRPFSVSVKPSSICVVESDEKNDSMAISHKTPLVPRLLEILKAAEHIPVTQDREDHRYTQLSLDAERIIRQSGHYSFGAVSQAMLHRTSGDLMQTYGETDYPFSKSWLRDRLCIGIYDEPSELAVRSKKEMKERLYQNVLLSLKLGIYPEIATHDLKLIQRIITDIPLKELRGRCEFQVLKGPAVVKEIEALLRKQDFALREYAPVEIHRGDGTPYIIRRLKANPSLVMNGAKDMAYRLFN